MKKMIVWKTETLNWECLVNTWFLKGFRTSFSASCTL